MSGGSFNYIYARLAAGDMEVDSTLSLLNDMLPHIPESKAKRDMEKLVAALQTVLDLAADLADVAKAVEWVRSGDWGEDSLQEELDKYAKEHPE
jgi:hypothetical protein